jgi:hypothetical protein
MLIYSLTCNVCAFTALHLQVQEPPASSKQQPGSSSGAGGPHHHQQQQQQQQGAGQKKAKADAQVAAVMQVRGGG